MHMAVRFAGQANAAGFGDVLQPCRNIDAVAVKTRLVVDHITDVDADPKLHAACRVGHRVALGHRLLHGNRALDGVYDACELGKDSVASRVDDTPAVFCDHGEVGCLVAFGTPNVPTLTRTLEGV